MKLGIIGTAGRAEDGKKLNKEIFDAMVKVAHNFLNKGYEIDTLVSGGSSYSDHCAVRIFNGGLVRNLILHISCKWNDENMEYVDTGKFDWRTNPGGTLNFYHLKFSHNIQIDSLMDINYSITNKTLPAKVIVTPGLMERNTKVAEDSDYLLAMTFGKDGKVKDGGTKDTCQKWINLGKNRNNGYHLDLNSMVLHKLEV